MSEATTTPAKAVEALPQPSVAAPQRAALVRFAVAFAIAFAIYTPILYYMVRHWKKVEDYSHGFLIAPLALYFAWERRKRLSRAVVDGSWWGLLPLALGVATLTIGRLGTELMNMRVSFVLTLIGIVLMLLGKQVFRILAFPLLFLFMMVPLPQSLVNVVAFPLQLIAADMAVNVLYLLEIPALREGNIIHLANAQLFVAEACSGLRSLMALVTLGVLFAYFFHRSIIERILIVLSAIPIAILVNAFRVTLTGVLTQRYGSQAAEGVIHQTEGLFTFAIAFVLLLGQATLVRWLRERWGARAAGRPA